MKKYKIFAYIFITIVVILLSLIVYTTFAKENDSDIRDKVFSEIQYFESKIIYIFNSINNIEFENYKISIQDVSNQTENSSQDSASSGDNNEKEQSNSSSDEGQTTSTDTKKYGLNVKGVLNSEEASNWNYIKNEAEMLQNTISTMTLDLYQISLNSNDIINFNKQYDNLLVQIKNEDKQKTLSALNNLYSYIPKFIKNCNSDEQYEIVVNTKVDIFNAYTILDSENWDEMNKYIQSANEKFSKLLTNVKIQDKKQYLINKCYITLNGLQTSIEQKDKEIFLIKYKNLLEDLNNI